MQVTRLFATIAFFVAIGITSVTSGQIMGRPGQLAGQPFGSGPYTSNPDAAVFDPGNLEYDMQPFAPLDISEFDEEVPFSGFYASYQRTYLSVSRPNPYGSVNRNLFPTGSDFQSGNRFNVGSMSKAGVGWDVSYLKTSGSFFSDGSSEGVDLPMWTTTEIHDLKINRVFRQPLSRGGFISPYFGVGYTYLNDDSIQAANVNFLDPLDPLNPIQGLSNWKQDASNSIVGGQVGVKLNSQRGRYRWASDVNLSVGYNSQAYKVNEDEFVSGDDVFPDGFRGNTFSTRSSSSFTPVLNASLDMSYTVTRDISVKLGGQISYIWNGVNRLNTLGINDNPNSTAGPVGSLAFDQQAMTVAGFTAGVEWRR